jgi:hypothetical protein
MEERESRVCFEGVGFMETLIDRLMHWVENDDGTPGTVPTRYACEVNLPLHADDAAMRLAVRQAFIDGMTFNVALGDAANRVHRV